jgi:hypothetical protein
MGVQTSIFSSVWSEHFSGRRRGRPLRSELPKKCRGDALSSPVMIPSGRPALPQAGLLSLSVAHLVSKVCVRKHRIESGAQGS